MATKVYVAVNGTCSAGPDENLYQVLGEFASGKREREFIEKLDRNSSGGGTVLWVKSPNGIYTLDTGDIDDRPILEKSLDMIEKDEKVDPTKAVIYHTHSHLDHNANNDLFMGSYWMVDVDDKLVEIALGEKDSDAYNGFRALYGGHRERGIISDKFIRYSNDEHPGKPHGMRIINTPGHDFVHKAFAIEDKEVVVINLESGEEILTDKVIFAGDCLCDEQYLKRFLDPELKETAIYGNAIPTSDWIINDQGDRTRLDSQNLESMAKIVGEKGLLIFGHGGMYQNEI